MSRIPRIIIVALAIALVVIASGVAFYPSVACRLFLTNIPAERIAFVRADGLYLMDTNGNGQCLIAKGAFTAYTPSPDGQLLAAVRGDQVLLIMGVDGSKARTLAINVRGYDSRRANPTWSPDGSQIAYRASFPGSVDNIVIIDVSSGEQQVLTPRGGVYAPVWSPDGTHIAFTTEDNKLYSIRPDGSEQMLLAPAEATSLPQWSPDSQSILYVNTDFHLAIVDRSGANIEVLPRPNTGMGIVPYSMAWSPDGETIAFRLVGGGTYDIYTIDPQSEANNIIATGSASLDANWMPDSRGILYTDSEEPVGSRDTIFIVDAVSRARQRLAEGFNPIVFTAR